MLENIALVSLGDLPKDLHVITEDPDMILGMTDYKFEILNHQCLPGIGTSALIYQSYKNVVRREQLQFLRQNIMSILHRKGT